MSRSRRENMARKAKAAKRQRVKKQANIRVKSLHELFEREQRASGMPRDVFAMAKLMGLR